MKRLEIIGNRSIQEEVLGALEEAAEGLRYTLLPVVHGRGKADRRLGTTVWPEENFLVLSYLEDGPADLAREAVLGLKARYPREGLQVFVLTVQ